MEVWSYIEDEVLQNWKGGHVCIRVSTSAKALTSTAARSWAATSAEVSCNRENTSPSNANTGLRRQTWKPEAQWLHDEAELTPVMTNKYLFFIIVIGTLCGMFSLNVADSKGHSPVAWFFAGFLFGPIGLIAACGLGDKRMSRTLRRIAESQKVGDLPALEFEDDDY